MKRLLKFFVEYGAILKPAKDAGESAVSVAKPAIKLLIGLGLVSPPVATWLHLRPIAEHWQWILLSSVPLICVAFWIGGMAWQRSAGPTIVMSELRHDRMCYVVTITNSGNKSVAPRVFLMDAHDETGRRMGSFRGVIESPWWGGGGEKTLAMTGAWADAVILCLRGNSLAELTALDAPNKFRQQGELIVPDTKRNQRRAFVITIGADCGPGDAGNRETASYKLMPDPNSDEYLIQRA